jgi:hypothetical protein
MTTNTEIAPEAGVRRSRRDTEIARAEQTGEPLFELFQAQVARLSGG